MAVFLRFGWFTLSYNKYKTRIADLSVEQKHSTNIIRYITWDSVWEGEAEMTVV